MTTAIYSGSFDPITNGHIEIIKHSSRIFDKVIVAVANNIHKKSFLTIDERIDLIKKSTTDIQNIEIASYNGLTVNFAKEREATILIRGLRNSLDFEYEIQLAQINETLDKNLKTIFIPSSNEYNLISSSMVKEILLNNGDISKFVPKVVNDYLTSKDDI